MKRVWTFVREPLFLWTLLGAVVASLFKNLFALFAGTEWNWWTFWGDLVVTAFIATMVAAVGDVIRKAQRRREDDVLSRDSLLRLVPVLRKSLDPSSGAATKPVDKEALAVQELELLEDIEKSNESAESIKFISPGTDTREWASSFLLDALFFVEDYAMMGARDRRLAAVDWASRDLAAVFATAGPQLATALVAARTCAFAVADQARWTDVEMQRLGFPAVHQIAQALDEGWERTSQAEFDDVMRNLEEFTAEVKAARANISGKIRVESPTEPALAGERDPESSAVGGIAALREIVELLALERMRLAEWAESIRVAIRASSAALSPTREGDR